MGEHKVFSHLCGAVLADLTMVEVLTTSQTVYSRTSWTTKEAKIKFCAEAWGGGRDSLKTKNCLCSLNKSLEMRGSVCVRGRGVLQFES